MESGKRLLFQGYAPDVALYMHILYILCLLVILLFPFFVLCDLAEFSLSMGVLWEWLIWGSFSYFGDILFVR